MRNRLHKLRGISLLFVLAAMTLSACVTQKKKGDVSKAAKFYHNTTALYNGYFNARELMDESILTLQEQEKDNYNAILSIYPESSVGKPEAVSEDLNKAIEKVSIVATLHEPSKWVDDCYVLIGQAQYLQQDFETAQETFEYFIEEFDPSNTKRKKRKAAKKKKNKKKKSSGAKKKSTPKKKKPASKKKKKKKGSKKKKPGAKKKKTTKKKESAEEKATRIETEKKAKEEAAAKAKKEAELIEIDRGKSGVFKHPNAFPEGLLWLSRTYVEREKYNLTEFYLNKIYDQVEVPKKVLKEIPVVKAYSSLDQKNYAEAIGHLSEAIPLEDDKKRKARLIFIQSQLYQKVGQKAAAFEGFNKVIAMKPDFLMEFNAGLNMLKSSMASGTETIASVQKKLEKMLKEDKNLNFRDQIYYTLGEINYEQKDLDEAIPNYRKAIQYNLDNNAQLVESYYVLAKIFYDREDYVLSKNYYDSTSTAMSKSDERFFAVQSYSENLTAIAKNINIIKLQDSLIMLSQLTPEERMEVARNLKKEQLIAASNAAKAKASNGLDDPSSTLPGNLRVNAIGRGGPVKPSFWAYDEVKVQAGKREFEKKYGFRQLSDDWRRSNKSSGLDEIQDISSDDDVDISDEEVSALLKDVPLTPDALAQTKMKLRTALFELGVLFREKIQNYKKSIEVHERLQQNYPGSEKEPDALYYLYLSHLDIDDDVKATYYLNLLKSKYPQEKYTLAITDPGYADNFLKESKKQERFYNKTYEKFTAGDYPAVLSMEMQAKETFTEENTFGSKYALLSAMSTGKIEGKDKYISALKKMIATYPNTPEQTRAKEILRFLSGDQEAFADINETEALEDFEPNDDKLHYVIIVVRSQKDSDLNNAKISISNYNKKYHKVDRIKVSSSVLSKDNNVQVILLRKFDNKEKAMKYYKEIERNKKEFMEPKVNYTPYAITQQNFREIMKKKSMKEYEVFFTSQYL